MSTCSRCRFAAGLDAELPVLLQSSPGFAPTGDRALKEELLNLEIALKYLNEARKLDSGCFLIERAQTLLNRPKPHA